MCSEFVVIPDNRESLINAPLFIDSSVSLNVIELDIKKNNTAAMEIEVMKSLEPDTR